MPRRREDSAGHPATRRRYSIGRWHSFANPRRRLISKHGLPRGVPGATSKPSPPHSTSTAARGRRFPNCMGRSCEIAVAIGASSLGFHSPQALYSKRVGFNPTCDDRMGTLGGLSSIAVELVTILIRLAAPEQHDSNERPPVPVTFIQRNWNRSTRSH